MATIEDDIHDPSCEQEAGDPYCGCRVRHQRRTEDAVAAERGAARREVERLRAACAALLSPLYRLLATLEIDNHDAQMDALLDVQEPFRRWRDALSSERPS